MCHSSRAGLKELISTGKSSLKGLFPVRVSWPLFVLRVAKTAVTFPQHIALMKMITMNEAAMIWREGSRGGY